jgi:hypothetical protein
MRLTNFLKELWETGSASVDRDLEFTDKELEDCHSLLIHYEKNARLNVPENLPGFNVGMAVHAVQLFYNISQMVVNRDFSENLIDECFSRVEKFEDEKDLTTVWSVDLIFQHLPSLLKIAKNLSEGDSLCQRIIELSENFPLSSVGIPLKKCHDGFLFENSSLTIIYLNRIIENQAVDRLTNEKTYNILMETLGQHSTLCKDLLVKFNREDTHERAN